MRFLGGVLMFSSAVLCLGSTSAAPVRIGFATAERTVDAMGPHNRAGWEAAQALGDAAILHAGGETGFVDAAGQARDLAAFDVVWYHQGDDIARTALYSGTALAALHAYAENGGSVLLSGGALAMVAPLGLERQTRPQRHQLEHWRDPAAMVPVESGHPAFAGLQDDDGLIWLSRGGCPAVADFYWGSPAEGMLLANSPRGVHRPLVEYTLGAGRVIVFGWHWPDYADAENPHRANLLKLTGNLLAYLADKAAWRPVVLRSDFPALAAPEQPGIAEPRWRALQLAIEDLAHTFPEQYPRGGEFLEQLQALKAEHAGIPAGSGPETFAPLVHRFEAIQREALLANPLLDFDRLLVIRRRDDRLGLPTNYNSNSDLPPTGYENTLLSLGLPGRESAIETVFTPEGNAFIGDLDLHYDAERLLLSTPNAEGRWGIAELDLTTRTLTRLPLIDEPDVHNYDACYLPDERIVFCSTAPFIGVPCIGGHSKVTNLYLRDQDGRIRRLTHDQDHNWCPAVLNNGRILYQRWEYADIAHTFMRILFHANPDGSQQMEYYGSNSFWPTAMFYARPIPGHPTKIVTVVGGHHDAPRQGELVILDPARGRHEADGAVQRIPGYGKPVDPVILDGLIGSSWPRFLHPCPLSEHYVIVSCKPSKTALWGVYLVDVFDNFVLLHEEPGWAMLEPTPWRKTARPPAVPDLTEPGKTTATVVLADVYRGPGLEGVPRGAVRALRVAGYEFTFHGFGGEPDRVGLDGPWDVRRILGTVPVEADGSAHFEVPASTPICVQPLDAEGKALALMRSWFTAAPGEALACVGCHEKQNMTVPADSRPLAARRAPSAITPWYGPARNFSFEREVQPVLDAFCVGCHNDSPGAAFDLTARPVERVPSDFEMHFSPSYMQLRRWVHTPTLESDAHMLPPRAFHADTSKLVQILRDDHYGVRLTPEAWDRLITWIDLNAPFHGSWKETVAYNPGKQAAAVHGAERRRELHRRYAGIDEDPEAIHPPAVLQGPETPPAFPNPPLFSQAAVPPATGAAPSPVASPVESLEISGGVTLELVRIEPGPFTLGSDDGYPNERPAHPHTIDHPFLMGRFEITNRQYACFDPAHDSGLETGEAYQFGDDERGFPLNRAEQPVVRVSWDRALAFCAWLSAATGRRFSLPTEAQWEYACRAGSTSPLWYGGLDGDFSRAANLSDATHYTVYYPHSPRALPPWRPADTRFDDGWRVSAPVGTFDPNPWGLHDMHGNVAEWTLSDYLPCPGAPGQPSARKVVRGGSWMDRPRRARSAFRLHYEPSQSVHDVGFRVVCETAGS
ncbi:MAG: formylglycine-generating enzyme family protein [Candidatus Hydrogenedentes bacterium]|nr:SUMF1/EgtB/PvdO family nonheme iron enzyme [Candidatus Hydrogenedentota bacterium]NLT59559.1 formylglycine-generating enzyme family protein [Candidatus Hydrogenedentota bacterium]HNV21228.1 SUMF1/EgtB/PvdO family nonheme iron enzyme [Candidatus Hydrogenedentota bacterium]HNZ16816.1 SUMF1/EgtB/PvdO family nonheme iron enzyme [Candidatus Hydrogenedentota bacterium]HOH32575.1 SUMF1/EgtB/PvdO family nonheme iron enzyme [Candidatus Hydrogenedentota bacterium]